MSLREKDKVVDTGGKSQAKKLVVRYSNVPENKDDDEDSVGDDTSVQDQLGVIKPPPDQTLYFKLRRPRAFAGNEQSTPLDEGNAAYFKVLQSQIRKVAVSLKNAKSDEHTPTSSVLSFPMIDVDEQDKKKMKKILQKLIHKHMKELRSNLDSGGDKPQSERKKQGTTHVVENTTLPQSLEENKKENIFDDFKDDDVNKNDVTTHILNVARIGDYTSNKSTPKLKLFSISRSSRGNTAEWIMRQEFEKFTTDDATSQ